MVKKVTVISGPSPMGAGKTMLLSQLKYLLAFEQMDPGIEGEQMQNHFSPDIQRKFISNFGRITQNLHFTLVARELINNVVFKEVGREMIKRHHNAAYEAIKEADLIIAMYNSNALNPRGQLQFLKHYLELRRKNVDVLILCNLFHQKSSKHLIGRRFAYENGYEHYVVSSKNGDNFGPFFNTVFTRTGGSAIFSHDLMGPSINGGPIVEVESRFNSFNANDFDDIICILGDRCVGKTKGLSDFSSQHEYNCTLFNMGIRRRTLFIEVGYSFLNLCKELHEVQWIINKSHRVFLLYNDQKSFQIANEIFINSITMFENDYKTTLIGYFDPTIMRERAKKEGKEIDLQYNFEKEIKESIELGQNWANELIGIVKFTPLKDNFCLYDVNKDSSLDFSDIDKVSFPVILSKIQDGKSNMVIRSF